MLGTECHQDNRVIRHTSPPPAVSVPFTPHDNNGMWEGQDLAPGWTGYCLALVAGGENYLELGCCLVGGSENSPACFWKRCMLKTNDLPTKGLCET